MSQPLGKYVGNALEVYECVKIMSGEIDETMQPTLDLTIELTARMLVLTGIAKTIEDASVICLDKIWDGSALEKFKENIKLQKGNPNICDSPEMLLEKNVLQIPVKANKNGFVTEIDTKAIGRAVASIGGGRMQVKDTIDTAVGFAIEKKLGDAVKKGESFGTIFCRNQSQADSISENLRNAYKIGEEKLQKLELIKEIIV
jgi:thymidine phosphorylase